MTALDRSIGDVQRAQHVPFARVRWWCQTVRTAVALWPVVAVVAVWQVLTHVVGWGADRSAAVVAGQIAVVGFLRPDLPRRWWRRMRAAVVWPWDAAAAGLALRVHLRHGDRTLAPLLLAVRPDRARIVYVLRPLPGDTLDRWEAGADALALRWGRPVSVEVEGSVIRLSVEATS